MSSLAVGVVALLRELEESLWQPVTRYDRSYMDQILHADFFEFGRSGRMRTREECLALPAGAITAELPLAGFEASLIGPGVALATYISVLHDRGAEVSNRSSLWSNDGERWRLRFHQGTPVVIGATSVG